MKYDLYHDESKEEGYWHGILLVPRLNRGVFLDYLNDIRKRTNYPHPVFLKRLRSKGRKFNCIRAWIQLGVGATMQYFKNESYSVSVEHRKKYSPQNNTLYTEYRKVLEIDSDSRIIGAKFILLRERDTHRKMGNGYSDYAAKVETTFRMGMTGGIHWLGGDEDPITISSIHFDGHKHYGRGLKKERIIDRIHGLRDYCYFDEKIKIEDGTSKHNKDECQDYEDCQFLQLTDLLVGSFRTVLGAAKNKVQKEVSFPVKELIDKWQSGYARMKNSRWFKGFWVSECWLESDGWEFGDFSLTDERQKSFLKTKE